MTYKRALRYFSNGSIEEIDPFVFYFIVYTLFKAWILFQELGISFNRLDSNRITKYIDRNL
jgi:hypothetical protein